MREYRIQWDIVMMLHERGEGNRRQDKASRSKHNATPSTKLSTQYKCRDKDNKTCKADSRQHEMRCKCQRGCYHSKDRPLQFCDPIRLHQKKNKFCLMKGGRREGMGDGPKLMPRRHCFQISRHHHDVCTVSACLELTYLVLCLVLCCLVLCCLVLS